MGDDFEVTTNVDASETALSGYPSDVRSLPGYFAGMTSDELGNGEEVHTTATLPDGQKVDGDAWFRVDESARRIDWGSEGLNDYHGTLHVADAGERAEVTVRLHTTRVADGDHQVQQGLDETMANIKRVVEPRQTIS